MNSSIIKKNNVDSPAITRTENAVQKRIELHALSNHSTVYSAIKIDDYVKMAKKWGHRVIALTDLSCVLGFPEFAAACKKEQIKPIYGMEGYFIDGESISKQARVISEDAFGLFRIVILAAKQAGLSNLYKLISLSRTEKGVGAKVIKRAELEKYREGLLIGSASDDGEVIKSIIAGQETETIEKIASFYDYFEIHPAAVNSSANTMELNRQIYRLGKKMGKPVCAVSNAHYLQPADEILTKILVDEASHAQPIETSGLHFRTTDEMLVELSYLGLAEAMEVVVENPEKIAAMIGDVVPVRRENAYPIIPGAFEKIRKLSIENAVQKYGDPLPGKVQKRLDDELGNIKANETASLYLIASEIAHKSIEAGYPVGSWWTVGSSIVAHFVGITDINPLPPHYRCYNINCKYSEFSEKSSLNSGFDLPDKSCPMCGTKLKKDGHKIPGESFFGITGDKIPDINLTFSRDCHPHILEFASKMLGGNDIIYPGKFTRFKQNDALRLVKNYFEKHAIKETVDEMNRLAEELSGGLRASYHDDCVVIVTPEFNIHDFTPLDSMESEDKKQIKVTHFDRRDIEKSLLVQDLGVSDSLTLLKRLEKITGISAADIDFDDAEALSIFSGLEALRINSSDINGITVGTLGVPGFESPPLIKMLEEVRPKSFGELVRIAGIFYQGQESWKNTKNLIDDREATLLEVISTSDDIFNYLVEHGLPAQLSLEIMERVRKGKGLKNEMAEEMQKFQVPQWYIDSCDKIDLISPKAHIVAQVIQDFRIAYFKVHHPEEFYSVYFSMKGISWGPPSTEVFKQGQRLDPIDGSFDIMEEDDAYENKFIIAGIQLEALARGFKI